jgi:hypothetical protein
MRNRYRTWMFCGLVLASFSAQAWAQTSGRTYHWLGDAGGDVTNPGNWLDLPDPDSGTVPGPQDFIQLRWGDRPPVALEYGAADATYEHVLFNHAEHPEHLGLGTTINGTGTLTFTQTGGLTNVNVKSIETQGGHRVSTVNANVNSHGMIEVRNGHDLVFNGSVAVTTVHAYVDDDQVTTSDVTFNGPVTHKGFGEAKFMTGTGTVRFNNEVTLDHTAGNSGFGIRNGMTMILGQGFSGINFTPSGGGLGLDTFDMYNDSTVKLEGDFVVGGGTDLFSRFGDGQVNTNTLDLNGHSDSVEFLGTHPGATFVIDFGATLGANSFLWETTHHHVGNYNIVNFEVGVDTLTLGNPGTPWWNSADMETDGGGSPNTEVDKSHMTINGLPYHAFDPLVTTPYWSLVNPDDPSASRNVQFFNLGNVPSADFNGDDMVDGSDFLIWQRGLGLTGQTTNANGDADRNGTVNGLDLQVWRGAFGGPGTAGAIGGVPEPATSLLAVVCAVAAMATRRRRAAA